MKKTIIYKIIKKIIIFFLKIIKNIVYIFEKIILLLINKKKDNISPVFIVWAPRSWSTYLYQEITNKLDLYYFSNYLSYFYKSPIIWTIILKIFGIKIKHNSFSSDYWNTKWLFSPSECGSFWYRWMPKNRDYVVEKDLNLKQKKEIYKTFYLLNKITQKEIIFKNLNCWQRIQALVKIFPNMKIIHIIRNKDDNFKSIYKWRLNFEKIYWINKNKWWWIRPKNFKKYSNLSIKKQIEKQITDLNNQIKKDKLFLKKWHYYEIKYEDFVKKPDFFIEDISIKFNLKYKNNEK